MFGFIDFHDLPTSFDMLPDLGLTHHRKSSKDINYENSTTPDLRGKNVLVTGGTSGLGAASELLTDVVSVQLN